MVRFIKNQLISLLVIALVMGTIVPSLAQDSSTILTVALPEWIKTNLDEEIFTEFEAAHPGVKVVLAKTDNSGFFFSSAAVAIEEHLDNAAAYAATADVLYINNYNLSVESTRAGYFLDLAPLAAGDPTLASEDFLPAAWQAFQWDRGIWGLPVSLDVILTIYDPKAFDDAGLSYPNEGWTLDDLANADQALSKTDANGKVILPGFYTFGNYNGMIIRGLLGHGLYDRNTVPNAPLLNTPEVAALLEKWVQYQKDGLAGGFQPEGDFDYNAVPIRIEQSFALNSFANSDNQPRAGALLPGGVAGLIADGFGVSAGTLYPEQAYELVKYLTNSILIANNFFGNRPARNSLIGIEDPDQIGFRLEMSPENQALLDEAYARAVPLSEIRYGEYVTFVIDRMKTEDADPQTILQEVEAQVIENLQIASDRRGASSLMVATPIPTPVLAAGEVVLKVNITSFISPMPNSELWDQINQEFADSDPEVGQVIVETGFAASITELAEQFDCFVLPYNATQTDDIDKALSLDPFLDADVSFDKSDMVGNVLGQVSRDNRIWAYPLTLQPQILWYNATKFAEAGVSPPENGWTVDSFKDALNTLKDVSDSGDPPFVPQSDFTGSYVLMLTAAYGGLPVDYRTTPPTINFTDPATVDAIRQVLDLAKDGYIEYKQLATLSGGGFSSNSQQIIYNDTLNQLSFRFQMNPDNGEQADNPYRLTTFPQGTQYTPVAYDIGTAYISASSQNPEACYRWISRIAQNPTLFGAMPARRSYLSDPAFATLQGLDLNAFYLVIDQLLQSPKVIEFPSPFGSANIGSPGNFVIQLWLNRAFDRYVMEDANLEIELTDAEMLSKAYNDCIAVIPAFDPAAAQTQREQIAYFLQFLNCATKVDPSLESFFPPLPE